MNLILGLLSYLSSSLMTIKSPGFVGFSSNRGTPDRNPEVSLFYSSSLIFYIVSLSAFFFIIYSSFLMLNAFSYALPSDPTEDASSNLFFTLLNLGSPLPNALLGSLLSLNNTEDVFGLDFAKIRSYLR